MVQGTTNQAIRGGQTSGLLGDAAKDNTNYNQQSNMSRKEDFKKASDDYVEGEPFGAQKIVGQVGFEFGAEYGYQYAQTHPNWISVEDELPEVQGKYMFRLSNGDMYYETYYPKLKLLGNVTHWMEIQPPRKEDKNNG